MPREEVPGGQATSPREPSCVLPRAQARRAGFLEAKALSPVHPLMPHRQMSSAPAAFQELAPGQGAFSVGKQKFPH